MVMSIMIDMNLKRNYIRARGVRLSPEEMKANGIVGVYNSVGEGIDDRYAEEYARGLCNFGRGERVIVERNEIDGLGIVSVILFRDVFVMGLYAMRNGRLYFQSGRFDEGFATLMN